MILGIGIIALSRWIIYSFNFKEILSGSDYKKLMSTLKKRHSR
jgi:hypothetical protein